MINAELNLANLPEEWLWASFEVIVENFDGQRVPVSRTERAKRNGDFPYYGASGIIDSIDGYLFDGHYLLIAEDGANLLSRSTPIAFEASGKFWVNNHAHIIQSKQKLIPLEFLRDYLNSIDLTPYVSGSAQPKLNQKNLNRVPIPLPPLNEQRRIVEKIEALTARRRREKPLRRYPSCWISFGSRFWRQRFAATSPPTGANKTPTLSPLRHCWSEFELSGVSAGKKLNSKR